MDSSFPVISDSLLHPTMQPHTDGLCCRCAHCLADVSSTFCARERASCVPVCWSVQVLLAPGAIAEPSLLISFISSCLLDSGCSTVQHSTHFAGIKARPVVRPRWSSGMSLLSQGEDGGRKGTGGQATRPQHCLVQEVLIRARVTAEEPRPRHVLLQDLILELQLFTSISALVSGLVSRR